MILFTFTSKKSHFQLICIQSTCIQLLIHPTFWIVTNVNLLSELITQNNDPMRNYFDRQVKKSIGNSDHNSSTPIRSFIILLPRGTHWIVIFKGYVNPFGNIHLQDNPYGESRWSWEWALSERQLPAKFKSILRLFLPIKKV